MAVSRPNCCIEISDVTGRNFMIETEGGKCLRVKLPTSAALQTLWASNREKFSFAISGRSDTNRLSTLGIHEWIFGNSKTALISAALDWNNKNIQVRWSEGESLDPSDLEGGFWMLENLPNGISELSLFNNYTDVLDKSLTVEDATQRKQELLFDAWKEDRGLVELRRASR